MQIKARVFRIFLQAKVEMSYFYQNRNVRFLESGAEMLLIGYQRYVVYDNNNKNYGNHFPLLPHAFNKKRRARQNLCVRTDRIAAGFLRSHTSTAGKARNSYSEDAAGIRVRKNFCVCH